MSKYIDNINKYMKHMQIKKTYISLKSGINPSTLSRILNGNRDLNISEMEILAKSLGKKVEYFLDENFSLPAIPDLSSNIVFYAGEPTKEQEQFALHLIELLDNAEDVLGAEGRFMMKMGD